MSIGIFHSGYAMGPGKVVEYLLMGFNELGVDYKVNQLGTINLFLQGHRLIEVVDVQIPNLFLGPNIADLPIYSSLLMQTEKYKTSIVPCEWVRAAHTKWIPENKVTVWNSGIDYKKWNNKKNNIEYDFLVYYKRRPKEHLDVIIEFLKSKNLKYIILEYNHYTQPQFADVISKSKWGLVIDGTETQGIAIQEMMSCDLPLLVWDVAEWHDRGPANICPATSIPYFDKTCGEIFYDIENIELAYEKLIASTYSPRNYILEHCNYLTQAKKLLDILYAL
jgi:hypothetical protein